MVDFSVGVPNRRWTTSSFSSSTSTKRFVTTSSISIRATRDIVAPGPWCPVVRSSRRVLGAYRSGRLSAERAVDLLWGTVNENDLPEQQDIPLDGLRREFQPLP